MLPSLLLTATLAAGQPPAYVPPGVVVPAAQPPATLPKEAPTVPDPLPPGTTGGTKPGNTAEAERKPEAKPAEEEKKEEKKEPDTYLIMNLLKGTALGDKMAEKRISISGWLEQSYTPSSAANNNFPVVWNDRANKYLLNQLWLRVEKATDPEAKEATFGWRFDNLFGTDYRFSLPRGLWNGQLQNSEGVNSLYGFDPIQFYANAFLPNLFKGTDIRVGRLFTPWGYESLEGVSTPFVSRSYAFNFSPPFTHMGIQVNPTFNDNWSGKFMLANGNDVFFDHTEELRFVGAVTYTSDDKNTTATVGTTLGRGVFNSGPNARFAPPTTALSNEPAGRNNINVFDFVLTHKFNDTVNYAAEVIGGYQNRVPANVPGGIVRLNATEGTAHWLSIAQYGFYNITEKLTGVFRLEFFDDFDGQRTGFEGLYTGYTWGLQWRPTPWALVRPELRYDHNGYTRPFEGKHDIFTAGMDLVLRF